MKRWIASFLPMLACACSGGHGTAGAAAELPTDAGPVLARAIVVSNATRTARATAWSVNYADWTPASGDDVAGTEALVRTLAPSFLRVGGYDVDVNTPDPFDDAALDRAIAYARAIGAEPILQVPLLRDASGQPPTAATAAAMVTYANVTRGYRVRYFSIGNEPDLYASQGAPGNPARGAIPNYGPADYCRSARDDVTAMKAVDPTIQIVGPDLAAQYRPPNADWLSPILQGCGDLFDVISIHRVPFGAGGGTLDQTIADPAAFRDAVASIRQIMELAGYGMKPLALTATDVASAPPPPDAIPVAAPGTVPAALWWADILGSSIDLGLWTAALPVTGDSDDRSRGLLGPAPEHAARPAYYAYELYAEHSGPTVLSVTSAPSGLSVYASRTGADDATEAVVLNWNVSSVAVTLEVNGASPAPSPAAFVLPPLSMSAISVPDRGTAAAWTYADAQHAAGAGIQPLAPWAGEVFVEDAGTPDGGSDAEAGPPPPCASVAPAGTAITVLGGSNGTSLVFGPDSYSWGSYTYGGAGQTPPILAATADGNGMHVTADVLPTTADANFAGFGLYYSSMSCLDVSGYTGLQFDFAGDLGGCTMVVGVQPSENVSANDDPARGTCSSADGVCYGPSAPVSPGSGTTVRVPFAALTGGMPSGPLDARDVISVEWQLAAPASTADGGPCAADFTIANVAVY